MQIVNSKEFEQIISQETNVLVDFFATWCGPCKMLGPVLEELDQKWSGNPRIIKVDVDESSDLAMRFGIMSVPTMILFKNGQPVKQLQGYQPAASLQANIEALL